MGWQDGTPVAVATPAWQAAPAVEPDMSRVREHFAGVRAASSFTDYLEAGWQQSVTGLATRGSLPDVQAAEDSAWYERFASSLAAIAGDVPAMVPGFLGGAAAGSAVGGAAGSVVPGVGTAAGAVGGSVIGGFAGAGALPAGLRAAMMEGYRKGEIVDGNDFLRRALHVAWETAKGGTVGAATGAAGIAAKAALPVAAGAMTKGVATTAAEVGALVTVGKALEGQLPDPQDFVDAAVLIGGLKSAAATTGKLHVIYERTGKAPLEVVADARRDPTLAAELAKDAPMIEIPEAYRPLATSEAARAAVPDYRSSEAAALDAVAVMQRPFAEIPQAKGEPAKPTHVNYNYLNTTEDAAAALSRLSEVYEARIQAQRRGTVSWEETSTEAARILSDTLGGTDTRLVLQRDPGTPAGAAEILARKQMVVGAAEDLATRARSYLAKGAEASPEDTLAFLASIERTSMIQSDFLGARAEAGRALNILRSTARDAERAGEIQRLVEVYGKDPATLARMVAELDNPAAVLKFSREATKATTWEKVIEAWKASILSGPVTHTANMMGNGVFTVLRAPVDALAATIGRMRGAPVGERVAMAEPLARLVGLVQGSADGLRQAATIIRTGEEIGPSKVEQHRKAIEGTVGEVVRFPFRMLSAEDALFRGMNTRAELNTLAVRQAAVEGLNPLTAEFRARVAQLVDNPTAEMAKAAEEAATRFTFNTPLGEMGQAVQRAVHKGHLEWAMPFIRTPINVFEELARMTPLAPVLKPWKEAFAKGGVERDRALAELVIGTGIMTTVFAWALEGKITGAGDPDPGKRRVQQAAGWQPYSVKIGDKFYSFERLQPVGTLMGIAADLAAVWDRLSDDEAEKLPKMLATAFANAVTNQTFLQGLTNVVNAMSDPVRFMPRLFQSYAGSVVPNVIAQPTAIADPLAREVDSMLDAIKARVPGLRQGLLPKRDVFGQPIETRDRLAGILPITEREASSDKVRTEAARLGVSAAKPPKKIHVGRGTGKLGDVEITPEQRDVFASVSGQLAYDILAPIVDAPSWEGLPERAQKEVYQRVFARARKAGTHAALPPEERAAFAEEIAKKMLDEIDREAAK